MSYDNCHETIGNPDPFRIIYNWCSNFPVPRWVGEKAYKNCYHCGDNFKSGRQHHCRLCGEMHCSRCTGKYNLPAKYELKGKDGPTRVCYQCKNTCVRNRQEAEGVRPFRLTSSFTPPIWQSQETFVSCDKCRKKEKNPHNCRLCGHLHCDTCTLKLDIVIPLEYNKKNKSGPHRVCDECRYRYKAGALIRGMHDPPSPESRYLDSCSARGSNSKSFNELSERMSHLSLSEPSKLSLIDTSSSQDEIPAPPPRNELSSVPQNTATSGNVSIITVKKPGRSTPIAVLEIETEGNLEDVHNALIFKCPEYRSKNIQLIVRGEPVSKSHWDIFKVRHCRGEVLVSEIGIGPTRVLAPGMLQVPVSDVTKHNHQATYDGDANEDNNSDAENENTGNVDKTSTSAFAHAVFNSRH